MAGWFINSKAKVERYKCRSSQAWAYILDTKTGHLYTANPHGDIRDCGAIEISEPVWDLQPVSLRSEQTTKLSLSEKLAAKRKERLQEIISKETIAHIKNITSNKNTKSKQNLSLTEKEKEALKLFREKKAVFEARKRKQKLREMLPSFQYTPEEKEAIKKDNL